MSNSTAGRIVRGPHPKNIRRGKERAKAFDALVRDFNGRCAYSLRSMERAGGPRHMEVDHFDPALKKRALQDYRNLFLATKHCNVVKGANWPTKAEQRRDLRFLNCCKETEYGSVIFEDSSTFELVGTTPAARYHIEMLDLNHPTFVEERRERAKWRKLLSESPCKVPLVTDFSAAGSLIEQAQRWVETMIPPIPPPPSAPQPK